MIEIKKSLSGILAIAATIFFYHLLSSTHIYAGQCYAPRELNLLIYADGVVKVEYELDVDPTLALVNISLFGKAYDNLIVRDRDGLLLDHEIHGGVLIVAVLGSGYVDIAYTTSDLTNKTGPMWTQNLRAPISANIQLPEDAIIISLSPAPSSIIVIGNTVSLSMPAGEIEIAYTLGTAGTREHARALINAVEATIEEMRAEGIIVGDAENLLRLAEDAYDEAQYLQAEQHANRAKASAMERRGLADEARSDLEAAESAVDSMQNLGGASRLDEAIGILKQAREAYNSGDYARAKDLAEQVVVLASQSKPSAWFQTPYIAIIPGTVVAASLLMRYGFARRGARPDEIETELDELGPGIDEERLFDQHPVLRFDEREVIRYIARSGSGAFVAEVRKRFDMPKSSAWRMIRRLEREEIVEIRKVGRETFVQINPRYRINGEKEG